MFVPEEWTIYKKIGKVNLVAGSGVESVKKRGEASALAESMKPEAAEFIPLHLTKVNSFVRNRQRK